jgi:hypothetical protein
VLDASVCRVDTGDKRADARDRRYHRTDQSRTGGVVEIHPWGSTIYKLAKPDRLVFDLAPGENVPWMVVIEAGCPRGPWFHPLEHQRLFEDLPRRLYRLCGASVVAALDAPFPGEVQSFLDYLATSDWSLA